MRELIFLKSKDVKKLMQRVNEQWGCDFKNLFQENAFFTNKEKIYVISRSLAKVDFEKLRINNAGLYILEDKNNELRLSVEGSQLLGPTACKNIIELNKEEAIEWLKGNDFEKESSATGFVIIKYKNDFFASGKFKEGKLLNFLPKIRRLNEVNV